MARLRSVRRIGITVAGLLAMASLALALVTSGLGARATLRHTCSATDRQFLEAARVNMTAMDLWGQQYASGEADGAEVVQESEQAAKIVRGMSPTDPSLEQTRRLMVGMLTEYARAVQVQKRHGDSGPHTYRAYGLANFAHNVLSHAQAPLLSRGCDVRPLL
jgi:hypothetical protein